MNKIYHTVVGRAILELHSGHGHLTVCFQAIGYRLTVGHGGHIFHHVKVERAGSGVARNIRSGEGHGVVIAHWQYLRNIVARARERKVVGTGNGVAHREGGGGSTGRAIVRNILGRIARRIAIEGVSSRARGSHHALVGEIQRRCFVIDYRDGERGTGRGRAGTVGIDRVLVRDRVAAQRKGRANGGAGDHEIIEASGVGRRVERINVGRSEHEAAGARIHVFGLVGYGGGRVGAIYRHGKGAGIRIPRAIKHLVLNGTGTNVESRSAGIRGGVGIGRRGPRATIDPIAGE